MDQLQIPKATNATVQIFFKRRCPNCLSVWSMSAHILMTSCSTWQDHLAKPKKVFEKFKGASIKVNAYKSFSGKPKMEYLGCHITQEGKKPIKTIAAKLSNA